MTLLKLELSESLGPKYEKLVGGRQSYMLHGLQSLSLHDSIYQHLHEEEKEKYSRYVYSIFKYSLPLPQDLKFDPVTIIGDYKPLIEQHVERRALNFFYQAISCYKTGLVFSNVTARHQGECTHGLLQIEEGKFVTKVNRPAAHSATLPCLIAKKLEPVGSSCVSSDDGVIYLEQTDLYRFSNSTITMPDWVNKADIAIDQSKIESCIRDRALQLLNELAVGKKNLKTSFNDFLCYLNSAAKEALAKKDPASPEYAVLHIYQTKSYYIFHNHLKEPSFFHHLVDVKILSSDEKIREKAFEARVELIRDHYLNQSHFLSKIRPLYELIKKEKKLSYYEHAFKSVLIDTFSKDLEIYKDLKDRDLELEKKRRLVQMKKFFSFTLESFLAQYKSPPSQLKSTIKFLSEKQGQFSNLAHELAGLIDEFKVQKNCFFKNAIKQFQLLKAWSDEEFENKLQEKGMKSSIVLLFDSKIPLTLDEKKALTELFELGCSYFDPDFWYDN